jgi:DNA helicase-2/ATP-dependent DNA helicase PcrA
MRRFTLEPEQEPPEGGADDNLTLDYEDELNEQQHAAATAGGGPVLVAAGAGTGKTRTLIYRLAYLVETGTRPQEIALLTFTRRAAREMTARAADLLDGRCRDVRGGTFHAFCLKLLRRHAPKLGFDRSFSILDASDAGDVWGVLRTRKNYHKGEKRFPNKRTLQKIGSKATNRDLALEKLLNDEYPQFAAFTDEIRKLRGDYRQYKEQHDLMDFDDLLVHALRLCEEHDDVRERIAGRCRHVLVDEYQDTNVLQAELVKHFASVHGNVVVVGDDAQSIYRFRGADFRNIFRFPDEHEGTRVLKLEQNYRSTQTILNLANHVIEQANRSYDKELFSEGKPEGDRPALVPAPDANTESRFVAQMALELREQGVPLNRIAVLFRSGYNSYDLETELNRRGIPFVKYGGMKLNEAAHIKDLTAHLKVLDNPQDAASWNRVLQLLHGIGPKTARDLINWLTDEDASREPYTLSDDWSYSSRYIEALKELFSTLHSIYEADTPLAEQVETLVRYYEPIMEDKYHEDFPKRQPDLEHFVALADNFSDRTDFLASLALDPIELSALGAEPSEDDEAPLILSTIHSAKGLEFHTVFLIQALEGVLPSGYSLGDADALDEELRLLYVAITRAEENLFASYPMTSYRRRRGEYMTDPSRFLNDVPDEILEPCRLVEGDPPNDNESDESEETLPPASGDGAIGGDDELPF